MFSTLRLTLSFWPAGSLGPGPLRLGQKCFAGVLNSSYHDKCNKLFAVLLRIPASNLQSSAGARHFFKICQKAVHHGSVSFSPLDCTSHLAMKRHPGILVNIKKGLVLCSIWISNPKSLNPVGANSCGHAKAWCWSLLLQASTRICRRGFPNCTQLDYFESKNGLEMSSVDLAASILGRTSRALMDSGLTCSGRMGTATLTYASWQQVVLG